MIEAIDDDLQVYLTPDNAESAQVAGVQFARALAGAPAAAPACCTDLSYGALGLADVGNLPLI